MILARFGRHAEIGAKEGRTKFGNKLLRRISSIAPTLAAKIAIEARLVPRPVRLMPISA